MANILVVDDELGIRDLLSEILKDEGHSVELAENAAQARPARNRSRPDLVLLDIWMPDTDGVTLLKEWSIGGQLTMPVIMMSGHATIDTAVEATKIGAQAFLEKPTTLQKLLKAVEAALARDHPRKPAGAPELRTRQAAARRARRVREVVLRIPPGEGGRLDDSRRREDRPRAHPPVPQAQAARRRPVARQTQRRLTPPPRPRADPAAAILRGLRPGSSVGRAED